MKEIRIRREGTARLTDRLTGGRPCGWVVAERLAALVKKQSRFDGSTFFGVIRLHREQSQRLLSVGNGFREPARFRLGRCQRVEDVGRWRDLRLPELLSQQERVRTVPHARIGLC